MRSPRGSLVAYLPACIALSSVLFFSEGPGRSCPHPRATNPPWRCSPSSNPPPLFRPENPQAPPARRPKASAFITNYKPRCAPERYQQGGCSHRFYLCFYLRLASLATRGLPALLGEHASEKLTQKTRVRERIQPEKRWRVAGVFVGRRKGTSNRK